MTTITKPITVFDSDSHVVEPPELWEKYLDPEYRVLGKQALWRHHGETNSYLKVNGEIVRDTMNPNIPRHAIWRPGTDAGTISACWMRAKRHEMNEGAWNPRVRLADMDAMGIDQAFLYPTWFAEGFHLIADPDTAYAPAEPTTTGWPISARRLRAGCMPRRCCRCRIWTTRWQNCAVSPAFRASAAPSSVRCSSRATTSPAHISIRSGRSWKSSAWSPRCIQRRACGTRNGPRTGHSSSDQEPTSGQAPLPAGGGEAIFRRRRGLASTVLLHRVSPARASDGAHPRQLAGQSYVRRLDADRLHRHTALSRR